MQRLEAERSGPQEPGLENPQDLGLWHPIYMAIDRQDESQPIGPGFAVAGSGYEALVAVKKIMEQGQTPPQSFAAGTEISLFFFTREMGWGTFGLKDIRQTKKAVTIRYQHNTGSPSAVKLAASSYCFALIPIGKPSTGNHAVNVVRLPIKGHSRATSADTVEERICKSFSFSIEPPAWEENTNE